MCARLYGAGTHDIPLNPLPWHPSQSFGVPLSAHLSEDPISPWGSSYQEASNTIIHRPEQSSSATHCLSTHAALYSAASPNFCLIPSPGTLPKALESHYQPLFQEPISLLEVLLSFSYDSNTITHVLDQSSSAAHCLSTHAAPYGAVSPSSPPHPLPQHPSQSSAVPLPSSH